MNRDRIVRILQIEFPGKKTICIPDDQNPKEIICEIQPASVSPRYGKAIAYIEHSQPHHHEKMLEMYLVERGELEVFVDGARHVLKQGERLEIKPYTVHWARSNPEDPARVRIYSWPGWTPEDHILDERIE